MFHLALELVDQYGFNSLNDYQFVMPRHFVVTPSFIHLSLYHTFHGYCGQLSVTNFTPFVLFRFRGNLFVGDDLFCSESILSESMQKSSKFSVEILALASSEIL
jgi:hypothetical protein